MAKVYKFWLSVLFLISTSGFAIAAPTAPPTGDKTSVVATEFGIGKGKWKVVSCSSEQQSAFGAERAIDDNPQTYWHTQYEGGLPSHPHHIAIDLTDTVMIDGFTYLPRQDGRDGGVIYDYEFYVSTDGKDWGKPVIKNHFGNIQNSPEQQVLRFKKPVEGRYIKLISISAIGGHPFAGAAEIGVLSKAFKKAKPKALSNSMPPAKCNLSLAAPVKDWWEALPIGNGQLGALIWGQDNRLTVKLDRVDIWDERFADPSWKTDEFTWKTVQEYVKAGNNARVNQMYNDHYHQNPPTHVAIGKLELTLPEGVVADTFRLDLASAQAQVDYKNSSNVKAFASATEPVIMMMVPGELKGFDIWAPGMGGTWIPALGYPAPVLGKDEDSCWYTQSIQEGPTFVVFAKRKIVGGNTLIAMTITTNEKDGKDPLKAARKRADKGLKIGYDKLLASHRKYWTGFWGTSAVSIPDKKILQHYYLTRYYLGSNSKPGFPAMATLQGIWTDDGQCPAFKNNLHGDLETQVQYQTYQTSGNFAEGVELLEFMWDRLPVFRKFAKDYYGTKGANMPCCLSWGGKPTGGWAQYGMAPTWSGWTGWLFYQHWRYTQDRDFLKNRAYPWCAEIAECWIGLLEADENGVLKLPLSASAEVFDNTPRAWMKPNTNNDRDLMQVHLFALSEMAQELGKEKEAARWTKIANSLGPRHIDEENVLMWSVDEKVTFLHRHFSHAMGIHPFNLLTIDGSDQDRTIIDATMKRFDEMYIQGGDWAGWSYPWMSSVRSRVGQGKEAHSYLYKFVDAYITRNGFHMNTSFNKAIAKGGHGWFFTIEGNMLANQAVHDMLIQSWAPSIGKGEPGIIRLFPAMPGRWRDAEFKDLRAEGGFKVSATRRDGKTTQVRIEATVDGPLRLRDPFPGRTATWNLKDLPRDGNDYVTAMRRGQILQGKAVAR